MENINKIVKLAIITLVFLVTSVNYSFASTKLSESLFENNNFIKETLVIIGDGLIDIANRFVSISAITFSKLDDITREITKVSYSSGDKNNYQATIGEEENKNIVVEVGESTAISFYRLVSGLITKTVVKINNDNTVETDSFIVDEIPEVNENSIVEEVNNQEESQQKEMTIVIEKTPTIINNPIREILKETVIERVISGVSLDDLQSLNNELRSEIYRVASNATTQSNNNYAAIALTNKIDNLGSVTITNPTITGGSISNSSISGTTGSYSGNLTTSGSLTVGGNATFDTNTLYVDATNNRVGVGTSTPTDTFSINGATYISPISAPSVTTDRLYNISNDLYWAGNLVSGSAVGNWTSDGTNVWRAGGKVGIGTSSPLTTFSIEGTSGTPIMNIASSSGASTIYVDEYGKVGIGTASPRTTLTIGSGQVSVPLGSASLPSITFEDPDTGIYSSGDNNISFSTLGYVSLKIESGDIKPQGGADIISSTDRAYYINAGNGGTESNPTYAIVGDTNTGIFSSVADTLSFTTGGGEKVRITSGGNVGIGTSSPFAKLSVVGQIVSEYFTATSTTATSTFTGGIQLPTSGRGLEFPDGTIQTTAATAGASAINDLSDAKTTPSSVFLGANAGVNDNGGSANYNTGVGQYALNTTVSGTYNSAFGYKSLYLNTGYYNTADGFESLYSNTTGSNNTATGYRSLQSNTTAGYNTATGYRSLVSNTTGGFNTAVGFESLQSNITGGSNVAIGAYSNYYNVSATSTTAIGYKAGMGSLGAYNQNGVFLGYQAGYGLTTGDNNLLLGYQAGDNLTTGDTNIVIGYDIDSPTATNSNTLTIGNLIYGTGLTSTGTTVSTGNIGIATSSPWRTLSVNGTAAFTGLTNDGTGYYACVSTSGELATSTTACGASSQRFKENVQTLNYGLDEVLQLKPVSFDWKKDFIANGTPQIGFIAEEVDLIIPEVTGHDNEGIIMNLDYPKLTAVIVSAIQELVSNIDERISNALSSITEFVVNKISSKEIYTNQICIEDLCIGRDEFKQILVSAGVESTTNTASVIDSNTDTQPPTLTLNGNNPAEIEKGSSYLDLGVTVTDNVNDNLGYDVTGDQIDTSTDSTHTITYTATDGAGNTATTTRTVIVGTGGEEVIPNELTIEEIVATTTPTTIVEEVATSTPEVVEIPVLNPVSTTSPPLEVSTTTSQL